MIQLFYYTKAILTAHVGLGFIKYEPVQVAQSEGARVASSTLQPLYKVTIDVEVDDTSYRYRSLMQKPQLVLKFSLPRYIDFPVGTWCVFQNQTFRLNSEKNLKKNGIRNITYNMTLGGDEDKLGLYKFRNTVDGRLKFSMCARPHELVEEVVKNLNKREGANVWSVGTCLESTEKTVEFNHCYIDAALQSIADTFETEWEIVNHVIHLRKVEYNKDNPLPLSYGRGNGFIPGLGRTTNLDEAPIKRIYTQGGTRNIDRSKYGGEGSDFPEYATSSAELLLPPSQTLEYEGRTYKTDAQGYYVERVDKVSTAVKEDSLDCSEIYPSRVGKVGTVITVKADKHFYDFTDSTIPQALDYGSKDCIIDGETPTIIFQSGMLAGKEFEYKYKHGERRFEIVPQEIDGIIMPDPATGYMPATGDDYAVFGIRLPKQYFFDNTTKTGASWDMFREAAKKLYESEDPKFTFKGDLQGVWAKHNWLNVGGKLIVGGYILFSDPQFAPDGVKIRITGIKDYVNTPYSPTLELSNSVSGKSVQGELTKIDNTEVVIEDKTDSLLQFTKRRFRDAKETIEMLEDAQLDMFTNAISPIAVQAMSMLIGDESLQFRFVSKQGNDYVQRATPVGYNDETKQLVCTMTSGGLAIYLQHLTLGHDAITTKAQNDAQGYKTWQMQNFTSAVLTDASKKYYLYAKCPHDTNTAGTFELSENSIRMDAVANYYYLLVGVLNSEIDGTRSFAPMHGFTEILPGRVTTERIVSSDGESFLDLVENAFKLGDVLDFNNEEADTLILNNAKIKNALRVLGEALIAGFYFSDERIRSSKMNGTDYALLLDGKTGHIKLVSSQTGGDYTLDKSVGSTVDIDATRGVVETRNSNGVAYLSASGIFCNNPKTNALPASTGYTHYGSIVGLGFGDNVNYSWMFEKESTLVAGVYGRASNTGNAPAFGGYFQDLCASGLILKQFYVTDNAATTAVNLGSGVTQVVGLTNKDKVGIAYLPTDGLEGKVIFAKQIGAGATRFYPKSGQKIFDDTSENDYYDIPNGWEAKFTFSVYNLNGNRVEVWLVSKWKF